VHCDALVIEHLYFKERDVPAHSYGLGLSRVCICLPSLLLSWSPATQQNGEEFEHPAVRREEESQRRMNRPFQAMGDRRIYSWRSAPTHCILPITVHHPPYVSTDRPCFRIEFQTLTPFYSRLLHLAFCQSVFRLPTKLVVRKFDVSGLLLPSALLTRSPSG
jgi:hypothetical protein